MRSQILPIHIAFKNGGGSVAIPLHTAQLALNSYIPTTGLYQYTVTWEVQQQ